MPPREPDTPRRNSDENRPAKPRERNMKDKRPSITEHLPAAFLLVICMMAASQWSLDRFWLYHSQNRVLQPSDYTASVVSAEQGAPADHQISEDGRYAIKVMTRGTSHAMDRVTQSLLPIFALSLIGLVATLYVTGRRAPSWDEEKPERGGG